MSDQSSVMPSVSLPILGFTFVLAFCSFVYELLLGQTLAAFFGNTVLRYSVTIGLYMFSMGVGALIAGPAVLRTPVHSLQIIEVALSLLGGMSVVVMFLLDGVGTPDMALSLIAHLMIIVIGILTGLELPLLIEIRSEVEHAASRILGVDYIGAFAGTVAFALWFYPTMGIFATAFLVASLNSLVGISLPVYLRGQVNYSRKLVYLQSLILVCLLLALLFYPQIEEMGIEIYVRER